MAELIRVNSRFAFVRKDRYWEVHESTRGINPKTKELAYTTNETYHPNLVSVCNYILDKHPEHKDLEDLAALRVELKAVLAEIKAAIGG